MLCGSGFLVGERESSRLDGFSSRLPLSLEISQDPCAIRFSGVPDCAGNHSRGVSGLPVLEETRQNCGIPILVSASHCAAYDDFPAAFFVGTNMHSRWYLENAAVGPVVQSTNPHA